VVRLIEERLGPTSSVGRGKYWRTTTDDRVSVFITYSAKHKSSDHPHFWYDVGREDLQAWLRFERSFVVFVMHRCTEALIIPASKMLELVTGRQPTGHDSFVFHVHEVGGRYEFRQAPGMDLPGYHNNYALLTN